jgi:hypothetical protein
MKGGWSTCGQIDGWLACDACKAWKCDCRRHPLPHAACAAPYLALGARDVDHAQPLHPVRDAQALPWLEGRGGVGWGDRAARGCGVGRRGD